MTKKYRIAALFLAVLVLLVMVFSLFVIAAEAGHDCEGEDCPICEVIALCENTVKVLSAVLLLATLTVALALSYKYVERKQQRVFCGFTPVALKVKLTN